MKVTIVERPPVHVAYLRHTGVYGPAIGKFWMATVAPWMATNNLIGREPIYRTLWDLVMSYFPFYWNYWTGDRQDLTLRGYATMKLERFCRDWVTAEEDLWFIEDYLYGIPYRALFPRRQRRLYLSTREQKIVWLTTGRGSAARSR